ncbi:MAG TPA: glycosyltransferase [Promineifilum sp.]|nr:glycosyltransferase [Promineifilum sp.]
MSDRPADSQIVLSIVVPIYNESEGLLTFHNELLLPALQEAVEGSYEIIYVNDGSRDNSLELLTNLARQDSRVRVINLSRNFGKEIATTAGISQSQGEATIIMDGDGQHPPAIIGEFLAKWRAGAQVVIGVRDSNQKEGLVKKWGSSAFYALFNSISGAEMVPRSTDYRLIDRLVRLEFMKFTERQRITRGLIDWLGFRRDYVTFDSPARLAGKATYKTSHLVKLAMNSFVSLSLAPLFIFGWIGVFITVLSFVAGIFIFVEQFLLSDPLGLNFTGSALLGIFTSFLIGLVLISQGIIAIYLSHVHGQSQARPLFVIDAAHSSGLHSLEK